MILVCIVCTFSVYAQPAQDMHEDSWQVTINTMDDPLRTKISRVAEQVQAQGGPDRAILTTMLAAAGTSLLTSAVDITATEVIRLATYRKEQKKEWQRMIDNECSYTDHITAVKGLNDFYAETSQYGALDPSNINFDGISVRGMRNGKEVLYLSCHIDTTRLSHLFEHSKFYLVLDTLCFHPYECHLPNLSANGIRASVPDSPRDNSFSYNEREGLTVGMELALTSSWINEAVMVQKDVELGQFKMTVRIPDGTEEYIYSRRMVEARQAPSSADNAAVYYERQPVSISGDCFVVPRSYMPLSGEKRMWGTGEYNVNITISEKCRFISDANRNAKQKNWHKDYLQLRKMQKKGSVVGEYLTTVWHQYGNSIIKSTIKQSLNAGVSTVTGVKGSTTKATSAPSNVDVDNLGGSGAPSGADASGNNKGDAVAPPK